jgi:hypothetical protein
MAAPVNSSMAKLASLLLIVVYLLHKIPIFNAVGKIIDRFLRLYIDYLLLIFL